MDGNMETGMGEAEVEAGLLLQVGNPSLFLRSFPPYSELLSTCLLQIENPEHKKDCQKKYFKER